MKSSRAVTRYAKSLIDLAQEQGALESVFSDMRLIHKTINENHNMYLLLKSPIVKTDKKQKILKAIFSEKISKITEGFILLLTTKRREAMMYDIAQSFVEQYKEKKKILTAVITTACGLDDDLRRKVLEIVKTSACSEVELIEKVDKEIIGGFKLQVGDKRIDASIQKQIRKLAMSFRENPYIKQY
jgi:F-type H+-transporting ATPase subunit delta